MDDTTVSQYRTNSQQQSIAMTQEIRYKRINSSREQNFLKSLRKRQDKWKVALWKNTRGMSTNAHFGTLTDGLYLIRNGGRKGLTRVAFMVWQYNQYKITTLTRAIDVIICNNYTPTIKKLLEKPNPCQQKTEKLRETAITVPPIEKTYYFSEQTTFKKKIRTHKIRSS